MTDIAQAGTFPLGDRTVKRLGYGAMQLAGPGVFGPPKDRAAAVAVLREAVAQGVDHIDTSDFYGPHITNHIVCVQNQYNLAHRGDDAFIDDLAASGTAYVPFFPLGGFSPLQSDTLSEVAAGLDATPMQVALAWLLRRSPNILLIPGTSSPGHLRENLAAAGLRLPDQAMAALDRIGAA